MRLLGFVAGLVLTLSGTVAAQASSGALRSVTYAVSALEADGPSGFVFIGDYGANGTAVVISLRGTPAEGDHPAHFHGGNCNSDGGIVVPLTNVGGATGLSVTLTDTPYDTIVTGDHYLNIHLSPDQMGVIVACGEVGRGAATYAGQVPGARGTNTTPVRSQEFGAPQTASYAIFAVEGSGVDGDMQVVKEADGRTRVVMTLRGITPGEQYPAAIYAGSCGPDRELVLELSPVGSSLANEPYAGITETPLAYEALVQSDNFVYIFAPGGTIDTPRTFGLDARVLACGEVGLGANR